MQTNNETKWVSLEGLALQYEVPIDLSFNNNDTKTYFDRVEEIDVLPFSKGTITFSSNRWDFSNYSQLNIPKSRLILNFDNSPMCFRKYLKCYAIKSLLIDNIKIQTIWSTVIQLCTIFKYLVTLNIFRTEDITISVLNDLTKYFLDERKIVITTLSRYKRALHSFILFYKTTFNNSIRDEICEYLTYTKTPVFTAWRESHISKDIPKPYFDKLLSALLKCMNSNHLSYGIRASAAMYILLSQIGIRVSESLFLSCSSLEKRSLFNGESVYYLHYKSWKGQRGNNSIQDNITYINDIAKSAFDFLLKLPEYEERRKIWNTKFLYCGDDFTTLDNLPVDSHRFKRSALKLMKTLDEEGLFRTVNLNESDYPYLNFYKSSRTYKTRTKHGEAIKSLAFPTTQQFRFHVCTELYKKGVPITYIQRFMSHLSYATTVYHVLVKEQANQNKEEARKILKGIVTGHGKILGNDSGITERINKFIAENNFNVEKDLETIVDKLADDIAIRIKTGGACIKSSHFHDCSRENMSNEFYCAYNVCPNLFSFYYFCGVTWRKCKELKEVIEINEKRGLLKQVFKDKNNLGRIIKTELIPQMNELEIQVKEQGVTKVYEEYPDLVEVVEHFNEIKEGALKWMKEIQEAQ